MRFLCCMCTMIVCVNTRLSILSETCMNIRRILKSLTHAFAQLFPGKCESLKRVGAKSHEESVRNAANFHQFIVECTNVRIGVSIQMSRFIGDDRFR